MNNYEFYKILLANKFLFVGLLAVSGILHNFIFRKIIITIFDPYLLPVIFSIFSSAGVLLLFFTGAITEYVFLTYALTQLAFWLGLFSFKNLKKKISLKLNSDTSDEKEKLPVNRNYGILFFYASTFILLLTQVTIYFLLGVPLFMVSRLETFVNTGGLGILGRITEVTTVCSVYSFFYIVRFDRFRISELFKYFLFGLVFITFLLSGSKSNFLQVFHILWAYFMFAILKNGNYQAHLEVLASHKKTIIIASVLIVLGVIYVQGSDDAFFKLALRFIHSADVYWYAYPNNVYVKIDNTEAFKALFTDTLGILRIYRWNELPEAIGITLKNIHHPDNVISGPNARHNVFGLVYFGFIGSIFFSFCLGWLLSFTRNVLPILLRGNLVNGVIYSYLVIRLSSVDGDPVLALSYIDNLLFIFPFLLILILILPGVILRSRE